MYTLRKILKINGAERSFICDPKNDSLADVLRNLGLTGTKIGCNAGQCGACNVILNGKLVRSCTRKIGRIDDYSEVLTIEGLGTAINLHPIQLAWIVYGGVQCGFCTPGFIVSTKALLDENPSPTREEVRAWYKKNFNACRCTGYKPLVDAAMAAAKVLRGEMTMEELWKTTAETEVFNTRAPKPTALGKVLGTVDYADDISLKTPGMMHLAPVMPDVVHGIIKSIDTSEAEKAPGVLRVITAKDIVESGGTNRIFNPIGTAFRINPDYDYDRERPILCDEKIYHRGDFVAIVVAETRKQARAAARLVKVEVEELPEYLDVLQSIAPDAVEIHPGTPNEFVRKPLFHGEDTRETMPKAKYIAENAFGVQSEPHLPIEPEAANAYVEEDGTITVMCKSHWIHLFKMFLAEACGIPMDKLRIILNPSGGAFGLAFSPGSSCIVAVCAKIMNGPVSLVMSYEEHQLFTGKRAAAYSNVRIGCDENGKLVAAEQDILYGVGSYAETVNSPANNAVKYFMNLYTVPSAKGLVRCAYTNAPHTTAYRGPAVSEVYANVEQVIDMLAYKAGIDPFDFRYQNVWHEGDIAAYGEKPDVYLLPQIMDMIRPKYEELKKHAAENSTDTKKYGVGVSLGSFSVCSNADKAYVDLEINKDNSFTVYNTWEDMGQGADIGTIAFVQKALEPIGVSLDQIHTVMNDTKTCPDTGMAAASRSNVMAQGATVDAANKLMDAMRKEDGTWRTYDEMVAEGLPTRYNGEYHMPSNPLIDENTGFGKVAPMQTYCVFVGEVEVNTETGEVKVMDMHVATDVGVVTNYLSVEGQAYSGMMHSIGYVFGETCADPRKNTNLRTSGFPYIDMIPDGDHFTVMISEQPRNTAFGGSGCSEGFQGGSHTVVLNAIYNAVGVRLDKQPVTKEKVKKAIEDKANGIEKTYVPWDFHTDFHETLDDIKAHPRAKVAAAKGSH